MKILQSLKKILRPESQHISLKAIEDRREEHKWEARRYECARSLVLQDRRSVVLGKLKATPEKIARDARRYADALIKELRTPQTFSDVIRRRR